MTAMGLIEIARENIRSLLEQCNVAYEVIPFDWGMYQECIDEATRRGHPVDGDRSVRTYLREGVGYSSNSSAHVKRRETQIWIALYMSYAIFVDDVFHRFLDEVPHIYRFNNRFVTGERQGTDLLDAFADILRRSSEHFPPIACHLIIASTMRFVTANLIEHETRNMKISNAALEYPTYQRIMSGVAEACAFMVFEPETPLCDYIQAVPEITLFIHNVNDVISFYKEERVGESTNQVSTMAARDNKSKFDTLAELTETTVGLYKRIVKILEGNPQACEAYKQYATGYILFHMSSERYELADLGL